MEEVILHGKQPQSYQPVRQPNTGIWFAGPIGGGLWERQFSKEGSVNVQWFGAKGDNLTNDITTLRLYKIQ